MLDPPANQMCAHASPKGEATVSAVKPDLRGLRVSASDGRLKAGACAPPLTRLAALTRPPDADSVPPFNRRCRLNSGMGFRLPPGLAVAHHGVEDGEQFPRHGDQRDLLGFSGGEEAFVEGLERRIMPDRHQRPHEQRAAHVGASAADEALAPPSPGLARPWRQAHERSDLATVERTQFRQPGQHLAGNGRPDAAHAFEQFVLLAPDRRGLDRFADLPVEVGELLLQGRKQALDARQHALVGAMLLALLFGHDHRHDLPAPSDEIAQLTRRLVRQRTRLGLRRFDEMGDHGSVDRIGLGPLAQRFGEGADLGRIDDDDRQAGRRQARGDHGLIAPGRFEADDRDPELAEPILQLCKPRFIPWHNEPLAGRANPDVQFVLGDIDSYNNRAHPLPSLHKRARLAAQATVRVRWTAGRDPSFSTGSAAPGGLDLRPATAQANMPDSAFAKLQGGRAKHGRMRTASRLRNFPQLKCTEVFRSFCSLTGIAHSAQIPVVPRLAGNGSNRPEAATGMAQKSSRPRENSRAHQATGAALATRANLAPFSEYERSTKLAPQSAFARFAILQSQAAYARA